MFSCWMAECRSPPTSLCFLMKSSNTYSLALAPTECSLWGSLKAAGADFCSSVLNSLLLLSSCLQHSTLVNMSPSPSNWKRFNLGKEYQYLLGPDYGGVTVRVNTKVLHKIKPTMNGWTRSAIILREDLKCKQCSNILSRLVMWLKIKFPNLDKIIFLRCCSHFWRYS